MRKLSRLFATKEASRGATPRRRRKVAHLAAAAESSAKLKVAAPVDSSASLVGEGLVGEGLVGEGLVEDGIDAMELEESMLADRARYLGRDSSRAGLDLGLDLARGASVVSFAAQDDSVDLGMERVREGLEESDNETSELSPPSRPSPIPFDSGVYVSSRFSNADPNLVRQVTLVVYEWHNVEPGTLSWIFPSVQAALSAARAMRNAVKWAVIAGSRTAKVDVESERASGLVLAEQAG